MVRLLAGGCALILAVFALTTAGIAEDKTGPDPALAKQALALNDITGEAAVQGKVRSLEADPEGSKKLIAAAAALARGKKDSPFTYTAAYILGQTARRLKDLEDGEQFFRICITQARKLGSAHKLANAYRGLLELLMERGKFEECGNLCREILDLPVRSDQQQLAELKLSVLQLYIESLIKQGKTDKEKQANTEKALALADRLVKARPGDWQVQGIKGAALRLATRHDQAIEAYKEMMKRIIAAPVVADEQRAWFDDAARYLVEQKKTDMATQLADEFAKTHPEEWQALEPRASVLRESGRDEDAAQAYEKVLEALRSNATMAPDQKQQYIDLFRYVLSGVYVDANRIDKAAEYLQALLAENPDNPTYNNDLGYVWADHDMNLDRSEGMIRKAMEEDRKLRHHSPALKPEEDRDNAAYLDSLGWVLFKKKQYQEAKKYLLEALKDKKDGQHIDIYDHLADVCMALGQRAEALAAWNKGMGLAGTGKRDRERKAQVEKKLKAASAAEARKP